MNPGPPTASTSRYSAFEIVLVLGDQLRVLRAAALHPVPDVEDHQPVVPIAQIGQPILHVDVVDVIPRLAGRRLPARHLPRLIGIADVDHPERAGRIVGEIDVAPVDERAVHAAGHRLGELRDRLGMRRILEGEDHDPVLPGGRILPGEHAVLAVLGGHDVVDVPRVHHHRIGDRRPRRIARDRWRRPGRPWWSGIRAGRRGAARTRRR